MADNHLTNNLLRLKFLLPTLLSVLQKYNERLTDVTF